MTEKKECRKIFLAVEFFFNVGCAAHVSSPCHILIYYTDINSESDTIVA